MSWTCKFTTDAEHDLRDLPKAIQRRVGRVIDQMQADPFQGSIKALQGEEWKGVYRRRIGNYRILFAIEHAHETVHVLRILLRSGKTYR